jgi:hypothetical protein
MCSDGDSEFLEKEGSLANGTNWHAAVRFLHGPFAKCVGTQTMMASGSSNSVKKRHKCYELRRRFVPFAGICSSGRSTAVQLGAGAPG